jgi:hypothetical protein
VNDRSDIVSDDLTEVVDITTEVDENKDTTSTITVSVSDKTIKNLIDYDNRPALFENYPKITVLDAMTRNHLSPGVRVSGMVVLQQDTRQLWRLVKTDSYSFDDSDWMCLGPVENSPWNL